MSSLLLLLHVNLTLEVQDLLSIVHQVTKACWLPIAWSLQHMSCMSSTSSSHHSYQQSFQAVSFLQRLTSEAHSAGQTVPEDPESTGGQQSATAAGAGGSHITEGLPGPLQPAGYQQHARLRGLPGHNPVPQPSPAACHCHHPFGLLQPACVCQQAVGGGA